MQANAVPKPNILFILHLPPPVHGASMVGKFIHQSAVVRDAFSATYINLATNTTLLQSGKGSLKKAFTFLAILSRVFSALLSNKYDLCYVTLTASGAAFYKDLLAVALLKLFGKKIIFHFHNKGVESWSERGFNRPLYRFAFRGTYSILLSEMLYYDIERYVDRRHVFFCPNGIPLVTNGMPAAAAAGTAALAGGIPGPAGSLPSAAMPSAEAAPCRLLFLSNMIAEKGAYVLLKACHKLKARGLRFECHFVGAWSDISAEDFNEKVLEYGLAGVAIAHGKKYNEDKWAFYRSADVFVFPTYYHNECFPLVLLEALQYALPVVSTMEGAIPDIVLNGETGLLVPQKDVEALTKELEFLILRPELRKEMGIEGRKRFDRLFTLETFEHNLTLILKKVIYAQNN